MKQRFLSIFTVVALMASVLAGAMGVSVSSASANTSAESSDAYLDDIYDYLVSTNAFNTTTLTQWFEYVSPYVQNETPGYFMVALEEDGNWLINLYQFKYDNVGTQPYTFYTGYNHYSGLSYYSNGNANYNYADFLKKATLKYYNGYGSCDTYQSSVGLYRTSAYVWSTSSSTADIAIPNVYEKDYVGRNVYCSMAMAQSANSNYTFSKNLFAGSATVYFDLGVFWLGTRQYISILQQDLMRDLDPEHLNDAELIVYLYAAGEGDYKTFSYDDVSLIPGDWQFFVNLNFTNVSPMGLYVIDITGNDWDIITGGEIYDSDSFPEPYAISDSRIEMNQGVPGTDGTPDSYTQSFNYFSEYVNNYNRTHYIPENLADTLFGLNGSRLYPCEVSVPVAVWNANANTSGGSSFADSHNWKWWFPSRDDYGINFELMDVVIVTEPYNDRYSLLYYYSDTLNVPFQYIQNMTFDELLEEFDCIIIVPDDFNCLDGNVWWKNLLTDICTFLGISDLASNLLTSLAISGSDSIGVEYVTERPDEIPGTLQGFCIVTKKAIQRQQLYVFNEGITKTYELMSNYLDERGKWEDSFLEWTIGLFYQWQTLDGKLGDIYNLLYGWNLSSVLSDISESLARIAANTSEEDPGYWFLSLFNWLNRFSVTDSDFANWVSEYDDFTDDLPDPGTGATVIPFPTAIPTVAVGG